MVPKEHTRIWFRACLRCGGDAYVDLTDEPEWRCLQCGRVVPDEAPRDAPRVALPHAA